MERGRGPAVPHQPMPCGIAQHHPSPCHVTDPQEALHTTSTPLIQCRYDPRDKVELPWIAGSTIIHLEGPNPPPNHLTS